MGACFVGCAESDDVMISVAISPNSRSVFHDRENEWSKSLINEKCDHTEILLC